MPTKHLRVLLPSTYNTDHQIEETGGAVIKGLDGNKYFTNLPVDLATVKTALTDFTNGIAAAAQGGIHATADKNKKRHDLIVILRKLALYVQANCNDDLAILTSSGFQAASTTRTLGPLPKPTIKTLDNGHSGQLQATIEKDSKAKSYELQVAPITGGTIGQFQTVGTFTKSRNLPINGLTPGANYAVRVRAIGGTTGYSDWSDTVTHMSL